MSKKINSSSRQSDSLQSLIESQDQDTATEHIYRDEDDPRFRIFIFEFLGTAIFCQGINASRGNPLFVAGSLFVAIVFSAPFSSGHINPAVSTAFWLKGQISLSLYILYSSAQFLGAFVGGCTSWWLLGVVNSPYISKDDWQWQIKDTIGEIMGTTLFITIILIMTNIKTSFAKDYQMFIFFTIAGALLFSRNLTYHSGGVLNPAIAIGLEFFDSIEENDIQKMSHVYIYIIGPYLGAVFATLFYNKVYLRFAAQNE